MRGKCLPRTKEKKTLNIKNSTNHGFTMDNGYELN